MVLLLSNCFINRLQCPLHGGGFKGTSCNSIRENSYWSFELVLLLILTINLVTYSPEQVFWKSVHNWL